MMRASLIKVPEVEYELICFNEREISALTRKTTVKINDGLLCRISKQIYRVYGANQDYVENINMNAPEIIAKPHGEEYNIYAYHNERYCIVFSDLCYVKSINPETKMTGLVPIIIYAGEFDTPEEAKEKFYYHIGRLSMGSNDPVFGYSMSDYLLRDYTGQDIKLSKSGEITVQNIVQERDPLRNEIFIYNVIGSYNGKRRTIYKERKKAKRVYNSKKIKTNV